jgi:hypothetical protein
MTDPTKEDTFSEQLRRLATEEWKNGGYIIIHPEVYKVIEDYKNYTPIQRFLWNIKWGFKDCRDNYRNWRGHLRGEEWDFWEILSGEWSCYE